MEMLLNNKFTLNASGNVNLIVKIMMHQKKEGILPLLFLFKG